MREPGAFFSGKLVDQHGLVPQNAHFTVVAEGEFRGLRGFVRVGSDHDVSSDGTFISPPLLPGKYYLRFFGMLQSTPALGEDKRDRQLRIQRSVFDFIYANADTVSEGLPFELQAGETVSSIIDVAKPVWFNVAGRVVGSLPVEHQSIFISFQRDMGILPDVGGIGFQVKDDGSFEGLLLGGSYFVHLQLTTRPKPVIIERDALDLEVSF
jgi:hypothetical protein